MPPTALIYKNLGETPLEALGRFRAEQIRINAENLAKNSGQNSLDGLIANLAEDAIKWKSVPMTYAGRLDPMAEGELLILIGDECKNKEKYLGLDKEYEVEILFGVTTDTHDTLGLVTNFAQTIQHTSSKNKFTELENNSLADFVKVPTINFSKYVGKFTQPYPAYSSKTVNGKQLHELARADELPDEIPEKQVEIYSIDEINNADHFEGRLRKITAHELQSRIFKAIDLVKGDFRQVEIKEKWKQVLFGDQDKQNKLFDVITIKVKCSSGTYMRSLAYKMGQDSGCGAIALSIKRTKIFL